MLESCERRVSCVVFMILTRWRFCVCWPAAEYLCLQSCVGRWSDVVCQCLLISSFGYPCMYSLPESLFLRIERPVGSRLIRVISKSQGRRLILLCNQTLASEFFSYPLRGPFMTVFDVEPRLGAQAQGQNACKRF